MANASSAFTNAVGGFFWIPEGKTIVDRVESKDLKVPNMNSSSRGSLCALMPAVTVTASFLIAPIHGIAGVQADSYSDTSDYKNALVELSQRNVRPSHLSARPLITAAAVPDLATGENRQSVKIDTDLWHLEISKDVGRIAITNKTSGISWQIKTVDESTSGSGESMGRHDQIPDGTLILRKIDGIQRQGARWIMQGHIEGAAEPMGLEVAVLSATVIRLTINASQFSGKSLRLGIMGPGPYFGLGEHFGTAKLDGQTISVRPRDKLGSPGHDWTYLTAPFLFTPTGLGMFFDTAAQSTFDLSQANKRQFDIQIAEPSVDWYFFIGDPKQILRDYTALTGRTPLPPPWAFGVWVNTVQGQFAVRQEANRLRSEGIPASALWLFDLADPISNLGTSGAGYFPTGYYGTPGATTTQLHNLGFKVLGYIKPSVTSLLLPFNLPNPAFEEGVRNHYFVLKPNGEPAGSPFEPVPSGYVDFTNPEAVDWWQSMLRRAVVDFGLDGWMEDFGEQIEDDDRFAIGASAQQMANIYPLLYHKASYGIALKLKPDIVEFSRSGYAGSQGYSRIIWGGDQLPDWTHDRGYPSAIPAGVTAGLSGFAIWAPDILSSSSSKELWIRWTEFGALTPVMRDHLWNKPKFAVDLWFDKETTEIFRRYARMHNTLFPYLYTYAKEAGQDGLPIVRHLLLEFPDDPHTYDEDHEYMLGSQILVAPVIAEGARNRLVYLPKGAWVNYWTGEIVQGGRTIDVPAPIEQIPIFVRAGSILPLADPEIQTLATDLAGSTYRTLDKSMRWLVFPSEAPTNAMFTDFDGSTAEADQGDTGFQVNVQHSPEPRAYELILPLREAPERVTLGGRSLGELGTTDFHARREGWWLDTAEGKLHVLFQAEDFNLSVARHRRN